MKTSDRASAIAVVVLVVLLVSSGPLAGGFIQPSGTPTTVDDGNATVASVDVDADAIHVSNGRFGTEVAYVRVPDARVELAHVSDRPRLVYRVAVPELGADLTATRIVTDRGSHLLHISDHGIDPAAVSEASYRATVSVRIQSFAVDRTVYERNVTVEVRR